MIPLETFDRITKGFSKTRVLVFGDVILDRYIFGNVSRISPEAPVPVVHVNREETRLGGAGNVAANIDALGGAGYLVGVAGRDIFSRQIDRLKSGGNHVHRNAATQTLVKTRIISQRQQIVRIDREETLSLESAVQRDLARTIQSLEVDGIAISDYGKGTLTPSLFGKLKDRAKSLRVPILLDPKPPHFHIYKDIDGITPNLSEAEAMVGFAVQNDDQAARAARSIRKQFRSRFTLITRGDRGITGSESKKPVFHLPAFSHEIYDVTGAGDTVLAVLIMSLANGADLREAASLANAAASVVIEKLGTSTVTLAELRKRVSFLAKSP